MGGYLIFCGLTAYQHRRDVKTVTNDKAKIRRETWLAFWFAPVVLGIKVKMIISQMRDL